MHSLVRHGMVFHAILEKLLVGTLKLKKILPFNFFPLRLKELPTLHNFPNITVLQLQPEVFVSPEPVLPQCIMGMVAAMLSVSKV